MRSTQRKWIWWIVLLAAVPRLVHLDAKPLGLHSWRQCDTAAVARNYHEHGYRLFFPQIDWAVPGYVEMEFPFYPWVVSLTYGVFGEHVALARLLAAAASVATTFVLFLLVRKFSGMEQALWAAFLWAVLPLGIYYGRAIMPESWMLASSVAGVYLFSRWTERPSWPLFFGSAALIALACLVKLPSLYLGLPLAWLAWRRFGPRLLGRWELWLFAVLVAVPVLAWYWHAHQLGTTYGATFGLLSGPTGKLVRWSTLVDPSFYNRVFIEFFGNRILTIVGFGLFLLGLTLPRSDRRELLFDYWLVGVVIVLLIGSGGSSVHDYYALPLLIPAVATMGRALVWLRGRSRVVAALSIVGVLSVSVWRWAGYLERERGSGSDGLNVAQDLRVSSVLMNHTSPSELVISCNLSNPTWLYLSRRKGWGKACHAMDKRSVAVLEQRGARYLVARHEDFASPDGRRLSDHLLHTRTTLYDDGEVFLVNLESLPRASRTWDSRFVDQFEDGQLPRGWQFETGRWQEQGGRLVAEPKRKQLGAVVNSSFAGCGFCAIRMSVTATVLSRRSRRSGLTLQGWRTGDSHAAMTLDFKDGRVRFLHSEGGVVVSRASRAWRLDQTGAYELEMRFDNFDFEVLLGDELVISVPNRATHDPFGVVALRANSVRLEIEKLEVLQPRLVTPEVVKTGYQASHR